MCTPYDIPAAEMRECLGSYCSGLTIISGKNAGGELVGMTCQSFHSLSLDPPLVSYFAGKTSESYSVLRKLDRFCINVLSSDQEQLALRFSQKAVDRWSGTSWSEDCFGQPVLDGSILSISCRTHREYDGGDHFINVSRVAQLRHDRTKQPLLYFRSSFAYLPATESA